MNKEQFFTFKSDLKKGMQIVRNFKMHRKAYYNDGFETKEDQDAALEAKRKENAEIKESMSIKILCDSPLTHWAYYIAKHQLDEEQALLYIEKVHKEMGRQTSTMWLCDGSPSYIYKWNIKPLLDAYEKL